MMVVTIRDGMAKAVFVMIGIAVVNLMAVDAKHNQKGLVTNERYSTT
jgi:hypothetical protein